MRSHQVLVHSTPSRYDNFMKVKATIDGVEAVDIESSLSASRYKKIAFSQKLRLGFVTLFDHLFLNCLNRLASDPVLDPGSSSSFLRC